MQSLTLRELVGIMWSRRRVVVVAALTVMVATAVILAAAPRRYDAIAWLMAPPDYGRYNPREAQWDAVFGLAGPADLRTTAKLVEGSPDIHSHALRIAGYSSPPTEMHDVARLWADVIEDTRIVQVRVRMSDAEDGARLANAICTAYQQEDADLRNRQAADALAAGEEALRALGPERQVEGGSDPDGVAVTPQAAVTRQQAATEQYRALLELRGRMQVMKRSRAPQWRVVRRAVPAEAPSVPNIPVTVVVGMLLTVMLPPLAALLAECYRRGGLTAGGSSTKGPHTDDGRDHGPASDPKASPC